MAEHRICCKVAYIYVYWLDLTKVLIFGCCVYNRDIHILYHDLFSAVLLLEVLSFEIRFCCVYNMRWVYILTYITKLTQSQLYRRTLWSHSGTEDNILEPIGFYIPTNYISTVSDIFSDSLLSVPAVNCTSSGRQKGESDQSIMTLIFAYYRLMWEIIFAKWESLINQYNDSHICLL